MSLKNLPWAQRADKPLTLERAHQDRLMLVVHLPVAGMKVDDLRDYHYMGHMGDVAEVFDLLAYRMGVRDKPLVVVQADGDWDGTTDMGDAIGNRSSFEALPQDIQDAIRTESVNWNHNGWLSVFRPGEGEDNVYGSMLSALNGAIDLALTIPT